MSMPLDISSRSVSTSTLLERIRLGERMPPVLDNMREIGEADLSNKLAIERIESPFCQRSQITAFCSSVYTIRVLYFIINTPSFI